MGNMYHTFTLKSKRQVGSVIDLPTFSTLLVLDKNLRHYTCMFTCSLQL